MNDYKVIIKQIESIVDKNLPLVSNLSNVSAILNQLDDINWVGFYLVDGDKLYLGPFQGDVACTTVEIGRGVCGTAFKEKNTVVVPNVNEFIGHIACSSLSKSEIVVPIMKGDEVKAVLDIDAPIYNRFNENDKNNLEMVAKLLSEIF